MLLPALTSGARLTLAQAPPSDTTLAQATNGFLNQWLVARNARAAVADFLSPLASDERFIPDAARDRNNGRFSAQWTQQSHPVAASAVQAAVADYLTQVARAIATGPLDSVVMPLTLDDARRLDPNLGQILAQRGARSLPAARALAYRVREWKDLQWTATDIVGLRTALPSLIQQQGLDAEAVVLRVRPAAPDNDPFLIVMIWTARNTEPWKLIGVDVPSTK